MSTPSHILPQHKKFTKNDEIMEELIAESVLQNTGKQRQNWRDHVNCMDRQTTTQQILQYMLQGKRSIECLAKNMAQDHNRSHGLTHVWNKIINI
jgi:hypothetical protein